MYRSLDAILTDHARRWPDRVWIESVGQGTRATFQELDQACHRVGHFLAARGVRPGDRVSILGENSLELVVLFLGIQRYGATVNPVNADVALRNLGQILGDVEPRLILWDRALPETVGRIVGEAGAEALPFGDDLREALAPFPASPCGPRDGRSRDIAIIDYTSGTTATPKGVGISREAFFYMSDSSADRLGLDPADRMLECRAMSWASPQVISIGPTLQAGARLVLAPKFSRRRFFTWIRDHGVTVAVGVPTVLAMLLEKPVPVTGADLPTLKFITSSAAPLPRDTQLEFERRYRVPVVQMCGMTEAGVMAGNAPGAARLGSIGRAMRHLEVRFVDERGDACAPGQDGELVVGGRQMASVYLTGRGVLVPIPQEGFRTGDVGHADADGYLYIVGRKKDLIIRGGVNVAPMEISAALLAHAGVLEAATIGVPDEIYGEGIVSFVVPRPGHAVTPEALLAHCRPRLSPFKTPQRVFVVEAIPKNERGKIVSAALAALWRERQVQPR